MPTTRFLLISSAGDTLVADGLRGEHHEVTVIGDLEGAVAAAPDHDVVVIDLPGPVGKIVLACRTIHGAAEFSGTPILCVSPTDSVEDRIRLLEAGADDVIPRPFDPLELDARAEALGLRLQRTRDMNAGVAAGTPVTEVSERRTIAVFSPKGGVGTTTLAVNIATWLANELSGNVVILDLDLQFGQVATHLNITPRTHLGELARDDVALRDPALFQASLERHGSGLMVLAAPPSPDGAAWITDETVSALLVTAASAFRVVVIDAGSTLDARTEAVFSHATDSVIVVSPEFPALKAVHALMEMRGSNDSQPAETTYVLNAIFARELLRPRDIEEALGTGIASTIPYDAFAFLKSVNEGVPIVIGSPNSPATVQLRRLAARLAGLREAGPAIAGRSKGLGGLFGR